MKLTEKSLVDALRLCGWGSFKEDGDYFCYQYFDNLLVEVIPETRKVKQISLFTFCSELAISVAYTVISDRSQFVDLCKLEDCYFTEARDVWQQEDIKALSDQAIAWAKAQDMEAGKARLRALPTDSVGAYPAWHLAALAEAGDVEKLSSYQDSFAKGDRLGFVNYITEDYIARALDFAKKRRADPNWLPDVPPLRPVGKQ